MIYVSNTLFEKVISLWPEKVIITKKTVFLGGGVNIPDLISAHDEVERKILAIKDNQQLLDMDWAIYTALHDMSKQKDEISPRSVDVERVKEMFQRNLAFREDYNKK